MKTFTSAILLLLCLLTAADAQNLVTYGGGKGDERFNTIVRLSDSTYLVGGSADDLSWLPSGTTQIGLSASGISNSRRIYKKVGFILHISPNLKTILQVLYFPAGGVQDIRHIKTSELPGSATGSIYISGTTMDLSSNGGGYFLAKLNNNFVSGTPNGLSWVYNVYASGYHQTAQPWDVGSDGKILFVSGTPYGTDSCVVMRLKANGSGPDIVDGWRSHYGTSVLTGQPVGGQWTPANANPNVNTSYSAIVMKMGRCELRSWSNIDYKSANADGNGGSRKGKWPLDLLYGSACDTSLPGKSQYSPGYTGYSTGNNPTLRVGAIVVDRRDNSFYIGASAEAALPNGLRDVEPLVLAYTKDGALKWWSRLHEETIARSWPVQEISALAIDYSQTGAMSSLVVAATAGGNTAKNFWNGNAVKNNPLNPGYAFQNKYTGGDTTVHVGWLGKLRLANGDLLYATYVAGYNPADPLTQSAYTEPIHDGWASHNAGNPGLSWTDIEVDAQTDGFGRVYLLVSSNRFISTKNAYQKMVKPSLIPTYASFLRVYEPDLAKLAYSSALTGQWNTTTGTGGNNTLLLGVAPVYNGAAVAGYHFDNNKDKISDGNSIPLKNVPSWGNSSPKAEEGILARLTFDSLIKAYFFVNPKTGACTNTNVVFTDTSYKATSWQWSFGAGANPSTASGKGPHTVKYSTADTVTVKLVVSNSTGKDSMLQKYIISAAPSSTFTYTGNTTSAPDTISFSAPSGSGLLYSWDFGDPSSGTDNTSSESNPSHIFLYPGTYRIALSVTRGNCTTTSIRNITISGGLGPANPVFMAGSTSGCTNNGITFSQRDTANSRSWFWSFGQDASPQTSTRPGPHTVVYSSPGPKTVSLSVGNGLKQSTSSQVIWVNSPTIADFTYTGSTSTLPATLIFSGTTCTGCTSQWDFGDPSSTSNNSTSSDVPHDFTLSGNYWVTYTLTDANGCQSTISKEIVFANTKNQYYTDFTAAPTSSCVGNKVSFTDMSKSNSRYRLWNFGKDAVPSTSLSADTVTVYWTTPGRKKVVLISGSGLPETITQKSYFYDVTEYPDAVFAFTGNTSSAPATITFTAGNGQGYLYSWNFGDPSSGTKNTASSAVPNHTYSSAGTYTVTLSITHNGCTSYYARNIYIGTAAPAIIPAFTATPSKNGCKQPVIIITDRSEGAVTSWTWNFGASANPGSASTKGPHTVTYNSPGDKTIKLTISNGTLTKNMSMTIKLKF